MQDITREKVKALASERAAIQDRAEHFGVSRG